MSLLPARMQINDPLPLLGEKVTPSVATARPTPEQVFETYSHDKMVPGGAIAPKPPLARNWTDEAIAEMLGDAWLHATWLSANPPLVMVDFTTHGLTAREVYRDEDRAAITARILADKQKLRAPKGQRRGVW